MNKQIKLLKEPYKTGAKKNSPFIFTIDDGTPNGVEMRTRDLQNWLGSYTKTITQLQDTINSKNLQILSLQRMIDSLDSTQVKLEHRIYDLEKEVDNLRSSLG